MVEKLSVKRHLESMKRLLKVINKPARKEITVLLRVSLIGVAAIGAIGFMIKVLFWIVGLAPSP